MPSADESKILKLRLISQVPGGTLGSVALIEVNETPSAPSMVWMNGRRVRPDSVTAAGIATWRIMVSGLRPGHNHVALDEASSRGALDIRSFPVEGPIFSGPLLQPWISTTVESGLGPPLDGHGNATPRVRYLYMPKTAGELLPYDPEHPPAANDIAITTTDMGIEVPYIVRHEVGALGRGIYEFAVLERPSATKTRSWNGKLWIYLHGGYNQYWSQGVLSKEAADGALTHTVLIDAALRRGFMIARTTFIQSSTNADTVRAAESLVMLKDHIVRTIGDIRFTFGSGASGGAIMQQMIANQYPSIFQGIIPLSSLHSTWYIPDILTGCRLLERYFRTSSPHLWQKIADRLAVDGHRTEQTRLFFDSVFDGDERPVGGNDPTKGTGLPAEWTYHPTRNPGGVRGTLQDYQVNYLGTRPEAEWSEAERQAGRGFAPFVWDNVGVQYGLGALLNGSISPEQFVDLNEKIGGVDVDFQWTPERTTASVEALTRLHRSGLINDFSNMADVAILDVRPPEEMDMASHTGFHTWISRDALLASQGHAANQVTWLVPGFATWTVPPEGALFAMDAWLTAIEADSSDRSLAEKVVSCKPPNLHDGVHTEAGTPLGDLADYQRQYPSFGDARSVAADGDLRAFRIAKAQLKPMDRADYKHIVFSDDQWHRIKKVFPDGVADWSRPGVGSTRCVPWLNYADGPDGTPFCPTLSHE